MSPAIQNLTRRVRSLAIIEDLQALSALGVDVESTAGGHLQWLLDSYRHNARLGEFDQLHHFVDPQAIAVDVGANRGQYALKLAAMSHKVVVIEPVAELAWLGEVLPPNCTFYNVAAAAENGRQPLTIPNRDGEPALSLATLGDYYAGEETAVQETTVRTLDSLLADCCPDERVGFIKIDVEGQETTVIAGAQQTIARWRPNLQVEIWPEFLADRVALFESLGYRGLFFFAGRLFDISRFDPVWHTAPEHAWRSDAPEAFDPLLYVTDFFFVPAP